MKKSLLLIFKIALIGILSMFSVYSYADCIEISFKENYLNNFKKNEIFFIKGVAQEIFEYGRTIEVIEDLKGNFVGESSIFVWGAGNPPSDSVCMTVERWDIITQYQENDTLIMLINPVAYEDCLETFGGYTTIGCAYSVLKLSNGFVTGRIFPPLEEWQYPEEITISWEELQKKLALLNANQKLKVKIGNDTTFCASSLTESKLGTNMIIEGGAPPYTYRWTTKINIWDDKYFYADTFLGDPTLKAPTFKSTWLDQRWEPFVLEVTDANNEVARDTINVRFSQFAICLGYMILDLNIGDEIELLGGNGCIGGGILPYRSYSWSPADDLLTPDSMNTICRVTKSTSYTLTIEDSVGCKASNMPYVVFVKPTSITPSLSSNKNNIYYDATNQVIVIDETLQNQSLTFELIDLQGNTILRKTNIGEPISLANFPSGIYLCRILRNGQMIYSDKILKR